MYYYGKGASQDDKKAEVLEWKIQREDTGCSGIDGASSGEYDFEIGSGYRDDGNYDK